MAIEMIQMEYDTFIAVEKIGSYSIYVQSLKDLDKAVDELCKKSNPKTPEEESEILRLCPYFGVIWPAARGLSQFISERKKDFNKKRGLEVGCGLALPSIVAAKMGAQMIATDFHPDVAPWVAKNSELNQVRVQYASLDWNQPKNKAASILQEPFDFILASDVLYEKAAPEELAKNLGSYLKPDGCIYLADPARVYMDSAIRAFENEGFSKHETVLIVDDSKARPIEESREKKRPVHIFELKKGP